MNLTLARVKPLIQICLRTKKVPYLASSPGLGKTSLMRQIAKENNLELIITNLGDADPTDFKGLPFNLNNEEATFLPFDDLPTENTPKPEGKDGWLIFLDELPSASRAVMASAHKLVLDRLAGSRPLHKRALVVAAGNLATDNTHYVPMTTPLASRMVHFEVKADLDAFINWAIKNEVDNSIIGFLRFRPDLLHKFDRTLQENTFPCPRTWGDLLSPLVKELPEGPISEDMAPLIDGCIGRGASAEFRAFRAFFEQIPTLADILSSPSGTKVPSELGLQYALTSMLTSNIDPNNAEAIMEYVNRLPIEMQATLVITAARANTELLKIDSFMEWVDKNFERFNKWKS